MTMLSLSDLLSRLCVHVCFYAKQRMQVAFGHYNRVKKFIKRVRCKEHVLVCISKNYFMHMLDFDMCDCYETLSSCSDKAHDIE